MILNIVHKVFVVQKIMQNSLFDSLLPESNETLEQINAELLEKVKESLFSESEKQRRK
jgi:hypothetical protein